MGLGLALAGCASNEISNMSPRVSTRGPDGLCVIEARWDSNLRAVCQDSMKPYVVIGSQFYPMQRTALTTNRWEATVPVPAGQRFLNYHFKFDYEMNGFGRRHPNSKLSPTYQIEIVE